MIFLVVSQQVNCPDNYEDNSTEIELKRDSGPEYSYYYTFESEELSISFKENQDGDQEKKYTVNLIIPRDVEINKTNMSLSIPTEGRMPTDITVALDTKTIVKIKNFNGYVFKENKCEEENCSEKLKRFMIDYLEAKRKKGEHVNGKEYAISIPLVFTSEQEGTIVCKISVEYKIKAVKGLCLVLDPRTGNPQYFFWEPGKGPNPLYDIEIRSEDDFHEFPFTSPNRLLEDLGIAGTFYELKIEELEPGTYHLGVKAEYDEIGESQWGVIKFTIKPDPVEKVEMENDEGKKITFSWEKSKNAEKYEVYLNNHSLELPVDENSYIIKYVIERTDKYLCFYGENILTIYAVNGNEKSEPRNVYFLFKIAPDDLWPNFKEPAETETFFFDWEGVEGAEKYQIQLFDSNDTPIELPYKDNENVEKEKTAIVSGGKYNPWDEREYGDNVAQELKPGNIYRWRVRAVRDSIDTPTEYSEWTTETFIYQPAPLAMLILFSAIGGLLGGFIRIAQEERNRPNKKKRGLKIFEDFQTYMDLFVGLFIGVIFYLIINQTLDQQLNILDIPPFNCVGSLILGFIGGVISYNITRLKVVPLE